MPWKLKRPCRHRGCPHTTRNGFCEQHAGEAYRRPADLYRGTPAERGYDSDWRRVREEHLYEHPVCEECLESGVVNDQQLEVDHVIPISTRPDLRLVSSNLRTLCHTHHQHKTRREQSGQGRAPPW
jgi:5-methylcytosine-specific restriction protein A